MCSNMKRIVLLLLTFMLFVQSYGQNNDALVGKIVLAANPCTKSPCLPGLVYAVETDTSVFIISIDQKWQFSDNPLVINNDTIELNDSIMINGEVRRKKDVDGQEYREIEVCEAILLTTSIELASKCFIQIYPNPTNGQIRINSYEQNIKCVELVDMSGRVACHEPISENNNIIIDFKDKGSFVLRILFENNQVLTKKIIFQ